MKLASVVLLSALALGAQSVALPSEPSQVYGIWGGIQGLGPIKVQSGYFTSQRIGDGTFTVQTVEVVRMPGGLVGTSARAGIYRRLWKWAAVTLGVMGDAGAAEGSNGSASGAVAGAGIIGVTFGHTPFGMLAKAQLVNVAGTGQQSQIAIGFTFSH